MEGVNMPAHVTVTARTEVETVIQFPDRGLIVRDAMNEYQVNEVRIRYRWSDGEEKWVFEGAVGTGRRVMRGTGFLGVTMQEIRAMHPDYRLLAQENQPRWRPPKWVRSA